MANEGSCTFKKSRLVRDGITRVERVWTCTASNSTGNLGSASAALITGTDYDEYIVSGLIRWAEIVPATGGDAPTAITTCKMNPTDDSNIDYLGGMGATASVTLSTYRMPLDAANGAPMEIANRKITPVATGLGNSKKITIRIVSDR